jgi:NNP family nitrate/nitrite transporter-like MFS transporter
VSTALLPATAAAQPASAPSAALRQAWSVLAASTLAFTVCFMAWTMFGVIGIPIRKALNLNATEFGLLSATPVLAGSLMNAPLGLWTDRRGGRAVLAALMAVTVPALWLMSHATRFWHFLLLGLFVGVAGGAFSVGSAYVARWFPRYRQGLAMGVYGAGSAGAAVNTFAAPVILVALGWPAVPRVYAALVLGAALVFWLFSYSDPAHRLPRSIGLREQLQALKHPAVLRYCHYYALVFGGYVALSLWMVQYYVGEYGLGLRTAALLAACFALPGGLLRALGGWLADRYGAHAVTWWVMWVSWIVLFLLSYPSTELSIQTANGPWSFHLGLDVHAFTALLFVLGIAWAFGMASVFKSIADEHPDNVGAVSGVVALVGGLAGFLLPVAFGALMDLTGIRSSAFMLLYGLVWLSLVWMYFAEVRRTPLMGRRPGAS